MLGDLGAEVIKIEHPTRGDDTRAWGPPFAKYTADSDREGPGESAYFLSVRNSFLNRRSHSLCLFLASSFPNSHPAQVNRNKKSVGLSFASPKGVEILHNLARTSDVFVENYLPGTLKRYNLDYDTLRALNPSYVVSLLSPTSLAPLPPSRP